MVGKAAIPAGTVQRACGRPSANCRDRLVDSRPVSKQSKRERQRLNREARREAELAATRRRKQMRTGRNLAILAIPLVVLFIVFQLRNTSGGSEPTRKYSKPPAQALKPDTTYTATIDTSEGTMVVALDAAAAPTSVNNFVFLAKHKFYDGLTFHRVAKDFVIQGGDPEGTGKGGPGYSIHGETPANGYQVGSVAWAKGGQEPAGTAGSQFFVVTSPAPTPGQGLDALNQQPYQYGIIGTVTPDTLLVAQKIGALAPASADGKPTKKVTIKKVTIAEAPRTTAGSVPESTPPSS
jgi:cyclophilin family peptidyl-prolyl cis-trans isomerase